MFAQKIVRSSLAFALVLTATSAALADAPARTGYRNSIIESSCTPASTTSYRDAATRVGNGAVANGTAKAPTGYRDAFVRGPSKSQGTQLAAVAACRM